jgi:hypothetical protein
MMAFYGMSGTGSALNDIRIDGSLHQIVYLTQLIFFFFKNPDKLFTNNLSFLLGSLTPARRSKNLFRASAKTILYAWFP